jgi:hypothetical protein
VWLRVSFLWGMMLHHISEEQTSDIELSLRIMCSIYLFPVKFLLMCRPSNLLITTTLIVLLPQPDFELNVVCGGKNMCELSAWHFLGTVDHCDYDLELKS